MNWQNFLESSIVRDLIVRLLSQPCYKTRKVKSMAIHSDELNNELDFIDTILKCRNKYLHAGRYHSETRITKRGGMLWDEERIYITEINERPVIAYYDYDIYREIIEIDYDVEEFKDNEKAFVGAMYLDTGEYMSIDEIEKHLSEKITFMCPKNYELLNTANNQSYSTIVYDQGCLMDDYALAQHLAIQFEDAFQIGDNILIKENGIDKYIGICGSLGFIELKNIEENKLANGV